eukprot:Polyplicarium_translucidae@DN4552_c0_g1_i1.p1
MKTEFDAPYIREVAPGNWHHYYYTKIQQSITGEMLYALCGSFGVVYTLVWIAVWTCRQKTKTFVLNEAVRFVFAWTTTWIIAAFWINFIKYEFGRLRPDFLHRCFPSSFHAIDLGLLQRIPKCEDEADAILGRQSFPSGHAGFTFSVLGFLAIHAYFEMSDCRAGVWQLAVPMLTYIPPVYVGMSRIREHRHHSSDVVGGAILGTLVAALCYWHYYGRRRGEEKRRQNVMLLQSDLRDDAEMQSLLALEGKRRSDG